jgi:hypothetical protein
MKGLLKFLLLVTVLLVIIVGIPLYGLYHLFFVADHIYVRASERYGDRVCISIPATIVTVAVKLAEPRFVFHGEEAEAIEAWRPAISALLSEIHKYPDMTILEAENGDDYVRIVKEKGKVRLHATSRGDELTIDVPAEIVDDTIRGLTDL